MAILNWNHEESEENNVSSHGELWTYDGLALLSKQAEVLSLRRLSMILKRSISAVLFQLLKMGRLQLHYGKGSGLPTGSLVGFSVCSGGYRFSLSEWKYTELQESRIQTVLDGKPTLVKLVNASGLAPISVLLWLFNHHRLVLNDGHDLGVEGRFFAVVFLLPPRPYKPSDGDMISVEEVMEGGSISYMARKHTPTSEQRDRLNDELSLADPLDAGGSGFNQELEQEQRQDLENYRNDVLLRRCI